MTTIQIKYSDIPAYLNAGDFYRTLDSEDPEGIIEIPADCFHQDGLQATDLEEFRQLLRVMEFWVLDDIPQGVLSFCNEHKVDVWDQEITDLPGALKQELQPLLLTAYSKPTQIPFGDIIATGRWDLIMHAVSRAAKNSPAMRIAAQRGDLRLLEYLHEHKFEWSTNVCEAAALVGQLVCLRYAHENGCPWNSEATMCAAQEGHVDCLAYAHENDCPWNTDVYLIAAKHGHLNCMQYAFSQGLELHADVCKHAVFMGHLDCLQFAHENGCPWDSETTECAAQEGHIHCLIYALEQGCPVDKWACNMACRYGHLDCLQLLHQFGAPWDKNAPLHAAHNGHIEPLRYALRHDCPYYDNIVQLAAHGNSLDCLRYTVGDQLLQMDEEAFKVALLRGDLACLQYLLDQGCPYSDAEFDDDAEQHILFEATFRKDNPEFVLCVEYAVQRGWVLCDNLIRYIVTRDEPCKQWLISEGHYWDSNNDEQKGNVGRDENTGVHIHIVGNVVSVNGAGDDLSVGASSDLGETNGVVIGSDDSAAAKSRRRYCVVM